MLEIAKKIGTGISFLRIDVYETRQGVLLGEITVYPQGNSAMIVTTCRHFNHRLGNHWKLNPFEWLSAYLINSLYWATIVSLKNNKVVFAWLKQRFGANGKLN